MRRWPKPTDALTQLPTEKIGRALALVCTLLLVAFHVVFATQAGALWRDEVNSLEVATMRTFSEMWSNMSFDSFPVLFFLLLRAVAGVPATISDTGLRIFGCGIGLLIVGMVWLNARWLRLRFPVIALALIGLNPMMIRYGDSIRGYGLGIALMLFSFGAIWRVTESCTRGRVALALCASLLSVHTLYYNSVLLLAVCMGGVAVMLRARRVRDAIVLLSIGGICALSMLPYRSVIQKVQATAFMWKVDFTVAELCENFAQTLGSHSSLALFLSLGLFAFAVAAGVWMPSRNTDCDEDLADKDRLLFALVALLVGILAYAAFLLQLSYRTRPWYYVVAVAFIAICLEMILASAKRKHGLLLARSAFTLLFVGTCAYPTFGTLVFRQTNVDHVAGTIERFAQPGDLVILNTWNYGISFRRYFDAAVPYQPVPPMEDLRSHRVDLVKVQMMTPEPIAPVLREIEATLRGGHTVWLIGRLDLVAPGSAPLRVAPGRDGVDGWEGGDFYQAWSEQIAHLAQSHNAQITRLRIPMEQPVMHHENLRLTAIRGWEDAPRTAAN